MFVYNVGLQCWLHGACLTRLDRSLTCTHRTEFSGRRGLGGPSPWPSPAPTAVPQVVQVGIDCRRSLSRCLPLASLEVSDFFTAAAALMRQRFGPAPSLLRQARLCGQAFCSAQIFLLARGPNGSGIRHSARWYQLREDYKVSLCRCRFYLFTFGRPYIHRQARERVSFMCF